MDYHIKWSFHNIISRSDLDFQICNIWRSGTQRFVPITFEFAKEKQLFCGGYWNENPITERVIISSTVTLVQLIEFFHFAALELKSIWCNWMGTKTWHRNLHLFLGIEKCCFPFSCSFSSIFFPTIDLELFAFQTRRRNHKMWMNSVTNYCWPNNCSATPGQRKKSIGSFIE